MKKFAGCIAILCSMGYAAMALAGDDAGAASGVPATVATPAAPQPRAKAVVQAHPRGKMMRQFKNGGPGSKSLDLRHCLDLKNNAAIAKCAGEL